MAFPLSVTMIALVVSTLQVTTAYNLVKSERAAVKKHRDDLAEMLYVAEPASTKRSCPRALWDAAHRILEENSTVRPNRTRAKTPALLQGIREDVKSSAL